MLGKWNARIKRIRPVSAGLVAGESLLARAVSARREDPAYAKRASPSERALLRRLRHDAALVVPGYWPASDCAAMRQTIDAFIQDQPDRVWRGPADADHRIHGIERVDELARRFHRDPWLHRLAQAYLRRPVANAFTLGARLDAVPGNRGSGQGWHRDGRTQRFKAILYLNDVSEDTGPFQYVNGTRRGRDLVRHVWRSGIVFRQRSFSEADVARIEASTPGSLVTATGRAGTLLIAATGAIHRGKPIVAGSRYALTNYYFVRDVVSDAVMDYYNRQVRFADGVPLSIRHVLSFAPAEAPPA